MRTRHMAGDERRARPPWLDYDVPEDQQIISGAFAKGEPMMSEEPKPAGAYVTSGAPMQKAQQGFRAYHGSPHDYAAERLIQWPDGRTEYIVGKPDVLPDIPAGAQALKDFPLGRARLDKMGSGEGAQAYGPGWYAAEAEEVGRRYRDGLAGGALNWDRFRTLMPELSDEQAAYIYSAVTHHDGESTPQQLATRAQYRFPDLRHDGGIGGPKADKLAAVFDDALQAAPGRMYEVRINADPNDFLDWDAPWASQPAAVQRAMREAGVHPERSGPFGTKEIPDTPISISAERALRDPQHMIHETLKEQSVPGIKYLDQGSRAAGQGSRNYVVFDDSLISIVKKYGIAGAASLYGMTQGEIEQALADQGQGGFIVAPEPTVE